MRRFAAVFALVGCTNNAASVEDDKPVPVEASDDVDAKASAGEAAEPQPIAINIAAHEPPEVTVLDAGSEPRSYLVLYPEAGSTEGIEIVTKTLMSMQGTTSRMLPTGMPSIVFKGKAHVEHSNGKDISFRHDVDAVELRDEVNAPAELVKDLRDHLADFEGYHADIRITAKGGLRGGMVRMPASTTGPVQQTMHQMTESFGQIQVPFPSELVGVGAKWRAEVLVDQAGLKLQQTVDYALVRREGETYTIEAEIRQELVDATFTPPGILGAEAKVTRFESTGKGSMNLHLAHLVPTRSEIEMKIEMRLESLVEGEPQTQDIAMVVGVSFART